MRRTLAVTALAAGLLLAGCSDSSDAEPINGEWAADGPQPPGFSDFGDQAMIRVSDGDKAVLGTKPMRLCGDAKVTAKDEEDGEGDAYRIAFDSPCFSVNVPGALDVVVDGDTLKATPPGWGKPFRFRRAD
ncbi:hypothetical protein [Streptomyces sp. G45]|uniref:hypothetical protein n=1 Tax=Streptomyces sp. G45 TaxID=3406627 RepID=UPI003C194645